MTTDWEVTAAAGTRAAPRSGRRGSGGNGSSRLTLTLIGVATLLALFLRLFALTRPGVLLGAVQYDDGVYLGSAIRLADGFMPYRDYAFVQPPGITLLMLPLGLLAKLTGTATSMAVARVLTACVGGATVVLGGLLVRHRGPLAVVLTCGILAVHRDSVGASLTLFLEPWVVLFCLLGALAVFEGDHLTVSRKRLWWGGAAIGVAIAIKAFALIPALALLALFVVTGAGRRAARFVGGMFLGFAVPVLPFVVASPRGFFDGVFAAQFGRTDVTHVAAETRLTSLFGTAHIGLGMGGGRSAVVVIVIFVLSCVVVASVLSLRRPPALDSFALTAAALGVIAFLLPVDYYPHYAAMFTPLLALSAGLSVARLVHVVSEYLPRRRPGGWGMFLTGAAVAAAAVLLVLVAARDFRRDTLMRVPTHFAIIDRVIPRGACVLSDRVSLTIMADRFISDVPGCSPMVDGLGVDLSLGHAHNALTGAGRYPAVQSAWLSAFARTEYVVLQCTPPGGRRCNHQTNRRIPWTPAILGYFRSHFQRTRSTRIFVRDGSPGRF